MASGLGDAVGVEDQDVSGLEFEGELVVDGFGENRQGDISDLLDFGDLLAAAEHGGILSGAGIGEGALAGVPEAEDRGDEGVFDAVAGELGVGVGQGFGGIGAGLFAFDGGGVGVEDGVEHGGDDGGGGAVAAGVGDEDHPISVRYLNYVVEIAAGAVEGLAHGGEIQAGDLGSGFGQKGALDVGDAADFGVDEGVGAAEVAEGLEIFQGGADQTDAEDEVFEELDIETGGLFVKDDDPVVEIAEGAGGGGCAVVVGEFGVNGVAGVDFKVLDDAGLLLGDELGDGAAGADGDVFPLPGGVVGDGRPRARRG